VHALEERILEEVERLSDEMVEICQKLVRVNTVNPYSGDPNPGNELNGQIILKPILEDMGAKTRMFEPPPDIYNRMGVIGPKGRKFEGRPNLVGEFTFPPLGKKIPPLVKGGKGGFEDPGGKRIIINGHMDTVAVAGMEIEPFSGEVRDGKIWGRGSSDCKGNLATGLIAIKALLSVADSLSGSVVYESVMDEECSGSGAGTLTCCHEGYTGDMAIVVDGSGLTITHGCGGCLTADVTVLGQGGHAARGGVSAIDKGLIIKGAIDNFKRERESRYPDSKVNLGIFNSGVHSAMVPSSAYLSLNIVYGLEEAERAKAEGLKFGGIQVREVFEHAVRDCEQKDEWLREHRSQMEWVKDLLPFETSKDDPLVQGLRSTFIDTLGTEPEVSTMSAWLDGAWIYHFANTPTVSFGAGKEGTAHADVEYIVIEDMKNCAKVLACFLYKQLKTR
jgi:acetylornithine deacetylase